MKDLRKIEPLRLEVRHGRVDAKPVALAYHFLELTEAQFGHQLTDFLGDEAHEVDDVLRIAGEAFAQLRILRGHADRLGDDTAVTHFKTQGLDFSKILHS